MYGEFSDDGYTGTNFNRPGFLKMMEAIKAKKINCIIVKDMSRFGREYIEAGKYIEKIFPQLGIRFIAINDRYDSLLSKDYNSGIIVPITNLMNDSSSRDSSIRIRSHLETKRCNGEFIGNFTVYGYKKSLNNKNELIIDEYAASVVRDIFKWKFEGLSPGKIAERLNTMGIPSPMEYKKRNGSNFFVLSKLILQHCGIIHLLGVFWQMKFIQGL